MGEWVISCGVSCVCKLDGLGRVGGVSRKGREIYSPLFSMPSVCECCLLVLFDVGKRFGCKRGVVNVFSTKYSVSVRLLTR